MAISFFPPHIHFVHRDPAHKLGVTPLYWSMFLTRLAQSFTGIFIPVYLVVIGLDLFGAGASQSGGQALTAALGFLFALIVVQRLSAALATFPAAWAARAFGFRWMIFFSGVMRAVVFILLLMGESNVWLLVAAMFLWGVVIVAFWPSFNTVFAEDGAVGHFGERVGWRIIAEKLAGVVGPVVGGVLVATVGFSALFILGIFLVILSSLPVFFMRHHNHADKVSVSELAHWLSEARFQKAGLSFVGYYVHTSSLAVVWPVFVFVVVASYQQLGALFSLTALVAIVMSWFVGKLFDRGHRRKLFKLGSVATAGLWIVRAALMTFRQILVVDSVEKAVSAFYRLPYLAYSYKRARGRQAFSFMVYRELIISVGAVGFWLLAIGIAFFPWRWYGLFTLAAVGVLLSQFILESDK